jgi:hypothetical protein
MLNRRLGKWGGQLLGGVIVAVGLLAPAWHQKAILVTFGLVLVAFERWRAPDEEERQQLERDQRRDEGVKRPKL